jgi:hypothetical protein
VRQATWDAKDRTVLAILDRNEIARIDPQSGNVVPLLTAQALPTGTHGLSGLALDPKRRMLFVTTRGGGGRLLRCDLDQGRWLPPLGLDDLELTLAYSPEVDALFGWQPTEQGSGSLYRFDNNGAIVSRFKLATIPTGGPGHHWQVVPAGNYLAILRQTEQRSLGSPRPRTQAYVLDPDTGHVVFTSRLANEQPF